MSGKTKESKKVRKDYECSEVGVIESEEGRVGRGDTKVGPRDGMTVDVIAGEERQRPTAGRNKCTNEYQNGKTER